MLTEFHTLHPPDTLGHAADLLLAGTQHDFPIVGEGEHEFRGLLTRSDLLARPVPRRVEMRRPPIMPAPRSPASRPTAHSPRPSRVCAEASTPCLQVIEQNETVGLLTMENIGEFLMVRAALGDEGSIPPGPGQRLVQIRN